MKIALNAISFAPGRMGGVETYFRNLVRSLQEIDTVNDYYLLCNRGYIDSLMLSNPHFTPLPSLYAKPSPLWYLRVALRDTIGLDIIRPLMNRLDMDIVHHPFSFLNPMGLRIPSVLTFIDMQHEFFPEYFSSRALRFRRALYRSSAEQANRIIAISEHARICLADRYDIAPEKIDAIHIGYNPQFRLIDNQDILESVRSRYNLRKPFIYYPAATWPHKNHKKLLAALKIIKERYGFDGQLVLSGIAMEANDDVIGEIGRLGLHEDVVLLGYLPEEDLPCLYNLARLMVFPSLYEGFGIPLVEAMACSCPVVCSNVTSIPEVVGNAAVTFDPVFAEDMAERIWALWSDDSLQQELKTKGLDRARQFSWENMARQTVNVYEKALG
ncbi:MAG: glycosyltransferase family 1 protein [Desulfuromonadaceae bacterium]|nr:glycosyltransferase family 1 protein [Desulfuromonadaceae bacterium]